MEGEREQPLTNRSLAPPTAGRTPPTVWSAGTRSGATDASGDLWSDLDDRLDLADVVPSPAVGVVVRRLTSRAGGCYYVLRSPSWQYLQLEPDDFVLWQRIDGRATVREIAVAQFVEHGEFVAERLVRLIGALRAGGFLESPPVDRSAAVRDQPPRSFWHRAGRRVV